MRTVSNEITLAESQRYEWEKETRDAHFSHELELKKLDIEAAKIEAKITSWFHLPVVIVTLPVRILLIVPLTAYAITHQSIPEVYKKWLR